MSASVAFTWQNNDSMYRADAIPNINSAADPTATMPRMLAVTTSVIPLRYAPIPAAAPPRNWWRMRLAIGTSRNPNVNCRQLNALTEPFRHNLRVAVV